MAYFAQLNESNVVTDVNVFDNAEINANGGDWSSEAETYVNNKMGGTWKQCSYNGTKRKSMAGIGYTYDSEKDIFYFPSEKVHDSWVWNEENMAYEPPIPEPQPGNGKEDGHFNIHKWDETSGSWLVIPIPFIEEEHNKFLEENPEE